jgi:hypothetical protein
LAPIDSFFGISSAANAANLDATLGQYYRLTAQIRALLPGWRDYELQRIEDMSWQGRNNLLNGLRMQWAEATYRVRGDAGLLQVETLRFLKGTVDEAYKRAVAKYNTGKLPVRLSREEAIGNYVDREVRQDLRRLYNVYRIGFGPGPERPDKQQRLLGG